jgi:hypothetical protein
MRWSFTLIVRECKLRFHGLLITIKTENLSQISLFRLYLCNIITYEEFPKATVFISDPNENGSWILDLLYHCMIYLIRVFYSLYLSKYCVELCPLYRPATEFPELCAGLYEGNWVLVNRSSAQRVLGTSNFSVKPHVLTTSTLRKTVYFQVHFPSSTHRYAVSGYIDIVCRSNPTTE